MDKAYDSKGIRQVLADALPHAMTSSLGRSSRLSTLSQHGSCFDHSSTRPSELSQYEKDKAIVGVHSNVFIFQMAEAT